MVAEDVRDAVSLRVKASVDVFDILEANCRFVGDAENGREGFAMSESSSTL